MAKTLADMTAEERADCVGMWCDNLVSTANNPHPVVLACVQGERCWILHADLHGEWSCFSLGSVSPRFDLPRAWTPDGQPVKIPTQALAEETWEYSYQVQNTIDMWEHPSCAGEPDRWWDTKSEAEEAALAAHEYGYPIRIVRRRVSPPEVINE